MQTINIHEAKTHLSRLVDAAAAGAEIVIAKAGRPVARLVPLAQQARQKRVGVLKGKLVVPDDFDNPLSPEALGAFGIDA